MGCAPSKQSVCRNCHAQCSPIRRSYASQADYSPISDGGGNHHVVALTSTTLGYLLLDQSTKPNQVPQNPAVVQVCTEPARRNAPEKNSKDFELGVIEAKTWSKMMDEKMTKIAPKTPIRTPPGEPETINSWELMEGLDDLSPLQPPSQNKDPNGEESCKPLWIPFTENRSDSYSNSNDATKSLQIRKDEMISCSTEKLILYFTSLRGVRKTYEDCCHVRVILKNSGVRVDERDVSMHSGFKEEIKELLGDRFGGGLPKVFIGKKYIGGADEIRRFHDEFQLDKVLEGCEMVDDSSGGGGSGGCEACGDIRFLPCETCSGICKIYYEINSDECEKEAEESDYGFQRCPDCNENGLIRCPICCH